LKLPPEQEAIRAKCFHPSGTFVEFPIEDVETSIPARFEKIVRAYPGRLAAKAGEHAVDYENLNRAANRIAHALVDKFGTDNRPIAVMLEHGIGAITAILAVFKSGKALVVLDASNPARRIGETLENSDAVGIVTNSAQFSLAATLVGCPDPLVNIDALDAAHGSDNLGLLLSPERLSQILYTSGSTGHPKGVVWDCRFQLHHAMSAINAAHVCVDDRLSLVFSPGSSVFPQNALCALLAGAAVLPLDLKKQSHASLVNWLIDEKITVYRSFASSFRTFAEGFKENKDFPDLRLVQVGGEQVSRQDVATYQNLFPDHTIFLQLCGSTETGQIGSYFVDHDTRITEGTVPLVPTSGDKEVCLLDDKSDAVKYGEVGEIVVESRYLARGYWKDPELTRQKFQAVPGVTDQRRFRTGDLGRALPWGGFVHLGRKDGLVKIRGYRIALAEIEAALRNHPMVKDAAVLAWDRAEGDKSLAAYIVGKQNPPPTVGDLLAFLRLHLPVPMLPSNFVLLDALPQKNGKLDRRSLPEPDRSRSNLGQPLVSPTSDLERQLVTIWEEVLHVHPIGIHDNFFELGGHSLAATRVVSRVLKQFQLDVPLRSLFEAPTVAQMAKVMAEYQGMWIGNAQLDRTLTEIEALSEEEARTLLGQKNSD